MVNNDDDDDFILGNPWSGMDEFEVDEITELYSTVQYSIKSNF